MLRAITLDLIEDLRLNVNSPGSRDTVARGIAGRIIDLASKLALIPIAIRAAEIALAVGTLGVGWIVSKLATKAVVEFVVRTLSLAALTFTIATLVTQILDSTSWVEQATTDFLKGLGFSGTAIAGGSEIAFGIYQAISAKSLTHRTPWVRWFAVGMSMLSLFILTAGVAFNLVGGLLFVSDLLSVTIAWGALMVYFIESEKGVQKAADLPSTIGVAFEKIVVFGTIPVATATMLTNAGQLKYG